MAHSYSASWSATSPIAPLVRTTEKAAITDLAAVIGAIGGGAVTKLYEPSGEPFAWYAIGLATGMAIFFILYLAMNGKQALAKVMVSETVVLRHDRTQSRCCY